MARLEGLNLIIVDDQDNFNLFKFPNSLKELQDIENYYKNNGQCSLTYEDPQGLIVPLTCYRDVENAFEISGTAQGLVVSIRYSIDSIKIPERYVCTVCEARNEGKNEFCVICHKPRPLQGKRVFNH